MDDRTQARHPLSYLLALAGGAGGSVIGAVLAARLTLLLAIALGVVPPLGRAPAPDPRGDRLGSVLLLVAVAYVAILAGSWAGSPLGSWLALRLGRCQRRGRTVTIQVFAYPLVLAVAGFVTVRVAGGPPMAYAGTVVTTLTMAEVNPAVLLLLLAPPLVARWLALRR